MMRLLAMSWLLRGSLTLAGPPAFKASSGKANVQSVKVPNPDGKKGGTEHQTQVREVAKDLKAREMVPKQEYMIPTPGGAKNKRFVDVVGVDPSTGEVKEMHQVGRQTKTGQPVAREKKALDDIQKATGDRPKFRPYNR